MEITVEIPEYTKSLSSGYIDGQEIEVGIGHEEIVIFGNKEGLTSLAANLLALAQDNVPIGNHQHLSKGYGLSDESADLVIGKL